MNDKLIKWCEDNGIDIEDLSDEAIDSFERGEVLDICDCCGKVFSEDDLITCEICDRLLCHDCFGEDISGGVCNDCLDD